MPLHQQATARGSSCDYGNEPEYVTVWQSPVSTAVQISPSTSGQSSGARASTCRVRTSSRAGPVTSTAISFLLEAACSGRHIDLAPHQQHASRCPCSLLTRVQEHSQGGMGSGMDPAPAHGFPHYRGKSAETLL